MAGLLEATGQTAEALAEYRKSEALLASLAGADPSARAALANCRSRMAWLLSSTGKNAEALAAYRLARSEQEALAGGPGALNEARRDLADTIFRIGTLLARRANRRRRRPSSARPWRSSRSWPTTIPPSPTSAAELAASHSNLGNLLSETGKPAAAEAEYRTALAIQQKLADEHPAVTKFRSSLAISHDNLGILLSETGKRAGRRPSSARPWRSSRSWPTTIPPSPSSAATWRPATNTSAGCCRRRASRRAAEAEYRTALAIQQKLADENPAVTDFRGRLSDSHNSLGILLWETGKTAAAEAEYRTAAAIQQKLADDNPAVTDFRIRLGASHSNLGSLLSQMGKPAAAEAEHRKALVLMSQARRGQPDGLILSRRSGECGQQPIGGAAPPGPPRRGPRPRRAGPPANCWRRPTPRRSITAPSWLIATSTAAWPAALWASPPAPRPASGRRRRCSTPSPRRVVSFALCPGVPTPRLRAWPDRPARACRPRSGRRRPSGPWPCCTRRWRWAIQRGRIPQRRRPRPAGDRDDFRLLIADLAMPAAPFTLDR